MFRLVNQPEKLEAEVEERMRPRPDKLERWWKVCRNGIVNL